MSTTNPHPVDSGTRPCCQGIGRHTPDCAEQLPSPDVAPAAGTPEDFAARVALVSLQGLRAHVQRRAEASSQLQQLRTQAPLMSPDFGRPAWEEFFVKLAGDSDTADRFYAIAAELSRAIDVVEGLRREFEAGSEASR